MIITNYIFDDKKLGYEIKEDGYDIYLDEKNWISQHEPYIPYPNLSYEAGCLKQIEEICKEEETQEDETQQRLSALEAENTNLYTTIDDILTNIIPAMMAGTTEESEE